MLDELTAPGTAVLALTTVHDDRPRTRRSGKIVRATTPARHWWSFMSVESEPDWPLWCSVFVSRTHTGPLALDPLLRLIADDLVEPVILAPEDFEWLYHPYDGGADVLLPSTRARDQLRSRHRDWLSGLPSGL